MSNDIQKLTGEDPWYPKLFELTLLTGFILHQSVHGGIIILLK